MPEIFDQKLEPDVITPFTFAEDSAHIRIKNKSSFPVELYLKLDATTYNTLTFTIEPNDEFVEELITDEIKLEARRKGPVEIIVTPDSEFSGGGGSSGSDGGGITEIAFSKDDLPSKLLKALESGNRLEQIFIDVKVAFNAGDISIGFVGVQEAIMPLGTVDLSQVGLYSIDIWRTSITTENLNLYFSGTPTLGSGILYIRSN